MANAKKDGKQKRNRANLVKKLAIIKKNQELISKIKKSLEI
jgi:hypothetical protein